MGEVRVARPCLTMLLALWYLGMLAARNEGSDQWEVSWSAKEQDGVSFFLNCLFIHCLTYKYKTAF